MSGSARHQRLITQNFVILGGGEIVGRLLGFAAMVYAARALEPEAYGVIGFALAVILYFQSVVDGGLELYGPRLVADEETDTGDLWTTIVVSRLGVALLSGLAVAAFASLALPSPESEVLSFYGLTLVGVALSARWLSVGLDRGLPVAVSKIVFGLLTIGMIVWLVSGPDDVARVPVAFASADLIGALLLSLWLIALGVRPGRFRADLARSAWRASGPLLGTVVLGLLIFNADFILLRVFRGREDVGYYLAAYALISFLGQLGNVARLSLIPTLSRVRGQRDVEAEINASALARVSLVAFPIALGGFLVGPALVLELFGAQYVPAGLPLQVLIWTLVGLLWRGVIEAYLIAQDAQRHVLRATGFAAILNIGLNLALIPPYGMLGAAIATAATEVVRFVLIVWYARRVGYGRLATHRLWRPAAATVAMGALVYVLAGSTVWVQVGAGVAAFALLSVVFGIVRRGSDGGFELAV